MRASVTMELLAAPKPLSNPTPRITTWLAAPTSRRKRSFSLSSIAKLRTVTMPDSTSLKRE